MEFKVERGLFAQALQSAQGIVERRNTLPILAHILIESSGSDLCLTATDLEIGLRRRCEASVSRGGAITVSARKLYEIVREAPEGQVAVRSAEGGWVEVLCGRSRFKIVGLDPREFPGIPGDGGGKIPGGFDMEAPLLQEMIDKTIFAVATDESRFNLTGVYVETLRAGKLRMVATDGHRLALIDRDVNGGRISSGAVLPRKGLVEVAKLLGGGEGTVGLQISGTMARVRYGVTELVMRLVEGEFPDYRQVLPQQTPHKLAVDREALLGALRRVAVLSSDRVRGVRLRLEAGRLELSTSNPDLGEAVEELDVEYAADEPISVGFNARYLLDVLAVLVGRVEIGLTDEESPGVVRGEDPDYTYVVMPMRL